MKLFKGGCFYNQEYTLMLELQLIKLIRIIYGFSSRVNALNWLVAQVLLKRWPYAWQLIKERGNDSEICRLVTRGVVVLYPIAISVTCREKASWETTESYNAESIIISLQTI